MLSISTNLYKTEDLPAIFTLLEQMHRNDIGIELFPAWQTPAFAAFLHEYGSLLARQPLSLHGPYVDTEHSAPEGTKEYVRSMAYFEKTLALSQKLQARYIVYHHNNCRVSPENRRAMLAASMCNLAALRCRAAAFQAQIVIENAGVHQRGNVLFEEEAFVQMAQAVPEKILVDIGHAHANGWDLERLICRLAGKITAYHVHNNNGFEDQHNRISDGTLDMERFLAIYHRYTPAADLVLEYGPQCAADTVGILDDVETLFACL